jgi:hypothetical protein
MLREFLRKRELGDPCRHWPGATPAYSDGALNIRSSNAPCASSKACSGPMKC